ncbi:hypothetical protein [Synechococcus sp. PCC 6312]|uniref:hypothetical protein n=1 Tax=Synechococcus sp. (strain ATCC 27167 / PCC 6312) TaxID=195253 RepID=UPI00029F0149|nr:hypothetical protein [Synechococcus sp. PCC 6312]AFY61206.1 hypothetical protein Syn6312_2081 [Synechococcus sp. PCC 6312]
MTYPIGAKLLLRTPLHFKKPCRYEVNTELNREGIQLLEADTGAISGLTADQITKYQKEAENHDNND